MTGHRRRPSHPIVITCATLFLIFFTEFILYQHDRLLITLERDLTAVNVDSQRFDASLTGGLIHMTGEVRVDSVLSDTYFPIDLQAAVLHRHVQIYDDDQWIDLRAHESSDNGYYRDTYTTDTASIGIFKITSGALERGHYLEPVVLDDAFYEQLPRRSQEAITKIENNKIYFATSPDRNTSGDERIYFEAMMPGTYSLLASQSHRGLAPYTPDRDDQGKMLVSAFAPKEYALFAPGQASPTEIIDAHLQTPDEIALIGRIIRATSWFLIFLGIFLSMIRHRAGATLPVVGHRRWLSALIVSLPMTAGLLFIVYGLVWYGIILTYTLAGVGLGVGLIVGSVALGFFDLFSSQSTDQLTGQHIFPEIEDRPAYEQPEEIHPPEDIEKQENTEEQADDHIRPDLTF